MAISRRKDWFKEAVIISLILHLIVILGSYFLVLKPSNEIFYVTMHQDPVIEPFPVIEKQPVRNRPLPIESEEDLVWSEEDFIEGQESSSLSKDDLESSWADVKSLVKSYQTQRQEREQELARALANEMEKQEKDLPQSTEEPEPLVSHPPSVAEEPAPVIRPLPPAQPKQSTSATPASTPVATPSQRSDAKESSPPAPTETKSEQEQQSSKDESQEEIPALGEEWDFLTQRDSNGEVQAENEANQAVGEAIYSLQSASRTVVKEPDFTFLEKQNFYTNSAFIRVRLSILADGSVIQVMLIGSGSGDNELDRLILASLLGMMFNDVSALRSTTQVGIITIRFG